MHPNTNNSTKLQQLQQLIHLVVVVLLYVLKTKHFKKKSYLKPQTNKPQTTTTTPTSTPSTTIFDPLSIQSNQTDIDPLSRALAAAISPKKDSNDEDSSAIKDTFEPWSSKKSQILSQYITTKKISMTTAMNNTNDESIIDNMKSIK